jgi:hypothetical protein
MLCVVCDCGLTRRPTLQAVFSRGFEVTTLSPSAVPAMYEIAPKTTDPSPAVLVPCPRRRLHTARMLRMTSGSPGSSLQSSNTPLVRPSRVRKRQRRPQALQPCVLRRRWARQPRVVRRRRTKFRARVRSPLASPCLICRWGRPSRVRKRQRRPQALQPCVLRRRWARQPRVVRRRRRICA